VTLGQAILVASEAATSL